MENILVPVDFSENSKNALEFAQELALYLDAKIKVIHVMRPIVNTEYIQADYDFEKDIQSRIQRLNKFMESQINKEVASVLTRTNIKSEVIVGFAMEKIILHAEKTDTDLIVMGTKGQGGVIDALFGSVSSNVSQKSNCPVLLVPKATKFKDFSKIMYASDFESSSNQLLEDIVDISSRFGADIHLVHVHPEQSQHDFELEELIINQIIETKDPSTEMKFVTIWDEDIWHGLNVYARDHYMDLMVMVRSKKKFWDRILKESVTKKMIRDIKRPILIFPTQN